MGKIFGATSLTDGKTLASYDGTLLENGDAGMIFTPESTYIYRLDASSGADENSPDILMPNLNPGDKRWILKSKIDATEFLIPPPPLSGSLSYILDNPDADTYPSYDMFSDKLALSDNYCVFGVTSEDDASGQDSGRAYIFENSTGTLLHTIDNPNAYGTSWYDGFGKSISITDNYCIVGSYEEDEETGSGSGKAYIFNTKTGELIHTLDNPNDYGTPAYDDFGIAVGINDTYCIVGAYQEDDAGVDDTGKAYIFNTVTGVLLHTLDNPSNSSYSGFGNTVAICDDYCIVGNQKDNSYAGRAFIFENSTGNLIHTINNPNDNATAMNDSFGFSVAMSNTHCIVGAYNEDDAGGISESGRAYVFENITGNLVYALSDPTPTSNGKFGWKVGISDTYSIVGSTRGKAFVYENSTGDLLFELDNPNAYGTTTNDLFGMAVDIKDSYILVGAPYEDDTTGDDQGKAYIFK